MKTIRDFLSTLAGSIITLSGIAVALLSVRLISGDSLPALITASFAALIVSMANGHSMRENLTGVCVILRKCLIAIFILMLTAAMVGIWKAGGTMPAMLHFLLQVCKENLAAPLTFLVCAAMAWVTGSSNSTILSIGTVMFSIGSGFGVSQPLLVGAIASGALMGNMTSPVSDAVNLISSMCEISIGDVRKAVRRQAILAAVISTVLFYVFSLNRHTNSATAVDPELLRDLLSANFHISPICLIPVAFLILGAAFRVPTIPGLFICVAASGLTAYVTQGISFGDIIQVGIFGFSGTALPLELRALLKGSGIVSLERMLLIIALSSILGGILSTSGIISTIICKIQASQYNVSRLPLMLYFLSLVILFVSGNQLMSTITLAGERRGAFANEISAPELTQILFSTSIVGCAFIPWCGTSAVLSGMLGESLSYMPYAFFCILTLMFGFLKFHIKISK